MLARLLAQARREPIRGPVGAFADVPADAWYANAVDYLAERGVTRGRADGVFDPEAAITHREFAVLAARFYLAAGGQRSREPPAAPGDDWAAQALQAAAEMDWRPGDEGIGLCPDCPVTRAEGVVILNRVLGRTPDRSAQVNYPQSAFSDVGPDHWAWYDILEAAGVRGP